MQLLITSKTNSLDRLTNHHWLGPEPQCLHMNELHFLCPSDLASMIPSQDPALMHPLGAPGQAQLMFQLHLVCALNEGF